MHRLSPNRIVTGIAEMSLILSGLAKWATVIAPGFSENWRDFKIQD
jgi:hypothetical protein